jgi:TRAP-type mannitol/chloroaromatic compound transport system permease small subunit
VLDAGLVLIGKSASWLWLVVVAIIIYAVVGRYAFGQGSVTLEEWQWHIAGAAWLLGLAYTLCADEHVRVDVIHERLSLRAQGWIEFFGLLLLLLPFLAIGIYETVPYAHSSFLQGERSQAPAGLENRWILKAILSLSFVLLAIGAISRLLKVTALLFGLPRPIKTQTTGDR